MTTLGSSLKSAAAGCEPFSANSLLPGPLTCTPAASVTDATSRCEPVPAFPLLPGPSTCPAWPSAAPATARCEPFPPNRLTPASRDSGSWSGTMAAGARKQAASCDAFVLSRRLPAPDAPPSRTSPVCLVAKTLSNSRRTTACDLWPDRDCRREFRQARSRAPPPEGVLTMGWMTDGVWQGLTGAGRRKRWSGCRDRQEGASGVQARERGETKRRKPERTEDGGARRTETDGGPGGLA